MYSVYIVSAHVNILYLLVNVVLEILLQTFSFNSNLVDKSVISSFFEIKFAVYKDVFRF